MHGKNILDGKRHACQRAGIVTGCQFAVNFRCLGAGPLDRLGDEGVQLLFISGGDGAWIKSTRPAIDLCNTSEDETSRLWIRRVI